MHASRPKFVAGGHDCTHTPPCHDPVAAIDLAAMISHNPNPSHPEGINQTLLPDATTGKGALPSVRFRKARDFRPSALPAGGMR
ncbi:hypothetical protein LJC22_02500 [Desulfosarcina sp. OttesenSCG-928-G10]|nr:hypothetical protein [Desulfosarcina sp. OttesenSCG-928-G10]